MSQEQTKGSVYAGKWRTTKHTKVFTLPPSPRSVPLLIHPTRLVVVPNPVQEYSTNTKTSIVNRDVARVTKCAGN